MTIASFGFLIISAALLCGILYWRARSSIALFLAFYLFNLFVAPAWKHLIDGHIYLGLDFPSDVIAACNGYDASFLVAATIGGLSVRSRKTPRVFDALAQVPLHLLGAALLLSLVVSYLLNAATYQDAAYFIRTDLNRFAAMMSLANGGWYLQTLMGLPMMPMVLVIGRLTQRLSLASVVGSAACLVCTYLIVFPATRTGVLACVTALVIARVDKARSAQARIRLYAIAGLLVLPILSLSALLNANRQGIESSDTTSLATDFLQYENGLMLLARKDALGSTDFSFLLATLSPLNLVPSVILPFTKPRADKDAYLTEQLFGGELNAEFYATGSTVTFGMPMTAITDFGIIGVVLAGLVFGRILFMTVLFAREAPSMIQYFLLYQGIVFIAALRFSVEGLVLQVQIVALVILAILSLPVGRRRRPRVLRLAKQSAFP